jgi:hypothetical protein
LQTLAPVDPWAKAIHTLKVAVKWKVIQAMLKWRA